MSDILTMLRINKHKKHNMKFTIKNRFSLAVIFECEAASWRFAVEKAVEAKANLSKADLSWADLSWADLSEANLSKADLSEANLSKADLSKADLSEANLSKADLSEANLSEANLSKADLSKANLSEADLSKADLSWANLSEANLSKADLSEANLSEANLSKANLSKANLSQSKGILPSEFLKQFTRDDKGFIVFRAQRGSYQAPTHWKFEPGEFLTETPNPCRTSDCGCGVSFATLAWVKENHSDQPIWKCRLNFEDAADLVVPYKTDGKARCGRLELIELL